MVKDKSPRQSKAQTKKRASAKKGSEVASPVPERVPQIGPNTPYQVCSERLTAFGGLLALVKFLDLIGFEALFAQHYTAPKRQPELGHHAMIVGILMLLFIGFQRLGHLAYVQMDPMLCGILRVAALPVVSTFWRYLKSLGINQSGSLLRLGAAVRQKVWDLCDLNYPEVSIHIDTTVSTVYGQIEGSRKGHNTKHRGKKGLRPVLCFMAETREYLCGTQRRGETICGAEVARQIRQFRRLLPRCVCRVHVRGDGEFISWESIQACNDGGFFYTFGNKRCAPPFPKRGWYRSGDYEYNECRYQPTGWPESCRFVVMRIRKDQMGERQLNLLESENYAYRVFVTNERGRPHRVIEDYDGRAAVEPLIGEAQREGVLAIPSKTFQSHHAFFQIVMLAYNLWRWMKLLGGHQQAQAQEGQPVEERQRIQMPDHTIRIARLKMLYVAAKIVFHGNRDEICYSIHEQRASGIIDFLQYMDQRREELLTAA